MAVDTVDDAPARVPVRHLVGPRRLQNAASAAPTFATVAVQTAVAFIRPEKEPTRIVDVMNTSTCAMWVDFGADRVQEADVPLNDLSRLQPIVEHASAVDLY